MQRYVDAVGLLVEMRGQELLQASQSVTAMSLVPDSGLELLREARWSMIRVSDCVLCTDVTILHVEHPRCAAGCHPDLPYVDWIAVHKYTLYMYLHSIVELLRAHQNSQTPASLQGQ